MSISRTRGVSEPVIAALLITASLCGCAHEQHRSSPGMQGCCSKTGASSTATGFEKGARSLGKAFKVAPALRDEVYSRDEAVRELKAILSRMPPKRSAECLIIDTYQSAGSVDKYSWAGLCFGGTVPEAARSRLKKIRFTIVPRERWQELRPSIKQASQSGALVDTSRVSGLEEVVLVSFYDGEKWHIRPHFLWSLAGEHREYVPADFALAQVMDSVRTLTGVDLLFESKTAWILIEASSRQSTRSNPE